MGRILVVVGVLLLIAGIAIPFVGSFNVLNDVINVPTTATADEARLCNPGETLEVERGASSRSMTGSTVTAANALYYCVNAAGARRDVSEQFYAGMMAETRSIFSGVGSLMTSGLLSAVLSVAGIGLIIFGVVLSVRDRSRVYAAGQPGVSAINLRGAQSPIGTSMYSNTPIGTPPVGTRPPTNAGGTPDDMIDFVRNQLDAAYRGGQISREDYDRAVEQLKRR